MNLPNALTLVAHLPGAAAGRGAAHEVRGAARSSACRKELVGGGHLRPRVADRLARRLPGAAPQADHPARPDDGPARRQAADLGGVHLARADGPGAGLDGGGHHRPRVRRHRPAQHRATRAASTMPASPLGKVKMVVAGRGDPAADPRARAPAGRCFVLGQIALWVVVVTARRLGRRLLPQVHARAGAERRIEAAVDGRGCDFGVTSSPLVRSSASPCRRRRSAPSSSAISFFALFAGTRSSRTP